MSAFGKRTATLTLSGLLTLAGAGCAAAPADEDVGEDQAAMGEEHAAPLPAEGPMETKCGGFGLGNFGNWGGGCGFGGPGFGGLGYGGLGYGGLGWRGGWGNGFGYGGGCGFPGFGFGGIHGCGNFGCGDLGCGF